MTQPNETLEIDSDTLAQQAYAEMEQEAAGEPVKKKEDDPAQPVEKQKADEASKPSEEEVPADDKQEESNPAEEEKKDEGEVKAEPDKTEEVKKSESETIQEYAIKHSMTWAEAREDIEKTKKVLENYKNDPIELARALRSTQSFADKLKAQMEQGPKEEVFQKLSDEQFLSEDRKFLDKNKDAIVAKFREQFPHRAELMSDEAIIEEFGEKRLIAYRGWAEKQEAEIKVKASEKREKVFENVKEADKRFIPDVKALLSRVPDSRLMSSDFDVQIFIDKVKGERYDADIKEAEERGAKRAQEQAKILGVKTAGDGKSPVKTNKTAGLNDQQKARALQMFPDMAEEQAIEAFKDVHSDDLKKNPSFVY